MYHLYKAFAQSEESSRKREQAYAAEKYGVTIPYTSMVTLSPSFFKEEMETGLSVCIGGETHLSYGDVMTFTTLVLNPLLDLLAEYARVEPDGAQLAAQEMIRLLDELDADDTAFPEEEIELIRQTCRGDGRTDRDIG